MDGPVARFDRPGAALVMSWLLGVALVCALVMAGDSSADRLLVASQNEREILEYNGDDGSFVRVFTSPVTEGFTTPGGFALRPSDGQLYVSSTGTGEIWRYDTPSGVALPPALASGVISPTSAVFSADSSTLYFLAADAELSTGTDSIKEVDIGSGSVSTIEVDGGANFSAMTRQGVDLFVCDSIAGRVIRQPISGGPASDVVSGLSLPAGVLLPTSTQMFIADTGNDRVLEYLLDAGSWVFEREVLPASAGIDGPSGLALAPDGRLTVVGQFSNDAVAVDLGTLAWTPLVAPGSGGLGIASGVAWSGSTLLIGSLATNSIIYYDTGGSPTGSVAAGLSAPVDAGFTISPTGSIIASSQTENDLVEFDGSSGSVVRKIFDACPTSLSFPFDVLTDSQGRIYVSCPNSDGIHRFDASGFPLGFFVIPGAGGLISPRGLIFHASGDLLVASGSGEILRYDGITGGFVEVFVDATGNGGGPVDPHGMAIHDGRLHVASFFPSEVREFDAATGDFVQTFVASGAGGLSGPTALSFGAAGDLYVTSFNTDSIKRYDGQNGSFISDFVPAGSGGLDGPIDLAFVSDETPPPPPTVDSLATAGQILLALILCSTAIVLANRSADVAREHP